MTAIRNRTQSSISNRDKAYIDMNLAFSSNTNRSFGQKGGFGGPPPRKICQFWSLLMPSKVVLPARSWFFFAKSAKGREIIFAT